MSGAPGFDRLARIYRLLEYGVFGGMLQRARTALLAPLATCQDVLVVGDGDGRGLRALLDLAPAIRCTSLDASAAMLRQADRRVRRAHPEAQVTWLCEDVRRWRPAPAAYDAVVTAFVLDCFTAEEVERIVSTIVAGLRPGGQWLFVDFDRPSGGIGRIEADVLVPFLYAFFRWQTGIAARALPPSAAILEGHGLVAVETRTFRRGLVRATRYERPSR